MVLFYLQIYLVNAQNIKCTFLRRIFYYFVLRIQLLHRLCSTIFRFVKLFFVLLHYFICRRYYFDVTSIIFFVSYYIYWIIFRVCIFFDTFFYTSLNFTFPLHSLFFILSVNYVIQWHQLKSIYFHIFLHTYVFFHFMHCSFGHIYIIFHITSLSMVFNTIDLYSGLFLCSNYQRTFSSFRGLTIHCYIYNNNNNYTSMPYSSTTS